MKHFKTLLFYVIIPALTGVLGSCCGGGGGGSDYRDPDISFQMNYYYYIRTIELIGNNKTTQNYASGITLNPADTVCSIRITYSENYYSETDSVWADTINLAYTSKPTYVNDGCENAMVMMYDARVSSTTFSKVEIINQYNAYQTIQITR